jgi:hypothetical protein
LAATPIGVGHPGFVAFAAVAPMIPMTVPTFSAVTSRQLAGSTNGFRGGVGSGLSTFRARMSPSASSRHATGSAVGSNGPRMDGARGAKKIGRPSTTLALLVNPTNPNAETLSRDLHAYAGQYTVEFPDHPNFFPNRVHRNDVDQIWAKLAVPSTPVSEAFFRANGENCAAE